MNDLLKAVIGLIVFAILLGAFIALRARDSTQQIEGAASPSPIVSPSVPVRSVGQTTQRSANQPANQPTRSAPASQTGASATTTTTTTTQSGGTTATGTAGSSASGTPTSPAPSAVGAGSKPVPALW